MRHPTRTFGSTLSTLIVAFILISVFSSCSLLAPQSSSSRIRAQNPNAIISLKSLKRSNIITALGKQDLTQQVRLVEIFAPGTAEMPEYRLFGILPGSIYEELGLIEGDVLLSCEGRFLVSSELFVQFVQLLPRLDQTSIEFKRGNKIYAMRYTIQ